MQWGFMTANYVAYEIGYDATSVLRDWDACHEATARAFHGPEFAEKFEKMAATIKGCGFGAIELWVAHVDPQLVTRENLQKALEILHHYGLDVIGYTAGFGRPGVSREDAVRIFETARTLGAPLLAQGFHPDNGELVQELASQYGIYMALENHPEKTPSEVIAKVSRFSPWVGAAMDTGWFATQGYDPVRAVHELREHLLHVHLKDIKVAGGHETCALGDGIVDVPGVLGALREIGYEGCITIEHEPMDHDPTEDVRTSLERARAWWAEIGEQR